MATKPISKSVRLSPEIYAYIDKCKGNGFNEKFENIIRHAEQDEPRLNKELTRIEKQIKKRQEQLEQIAQKVTTLDITINAIFNLSEEVSRLQKQISDLINSS